MCVARRSLCKFCFFSSNLEHTHALYNGGFADCTLPRAYLDLEVALRLSIQISEIQTKFELNPRNPEKVTEALQTTFLPNFEAGA